MNKELHQDGMSQQSIEAIRADLDQAERGFTWDQIQTELDYNGQGNKLEPDTTAFLTDVAGKVRVTKEPSTTIQGTDEWIPGSTSYTYEYVGADGTTKSDKLSSTVAEGLLSYAAKVKAKEASDKVASEYAQKAAAHADKKLSIQDVSKMSVSELADKSGLSQAEIHKLGKTGALDKINDSIIAKEVAKADVAAAEKAKADAIAAEERAAKEQANREQSHKDHEAAWAQNEAYAKQLAKDEQVAGIGVLNAYKMSVSELSELTGVSQSEIHNKGKDYAIKLAEARIAERTANSKQSATDNLGITRDTAAEARASELGALLRAHDRSLGKAVESEGFPAPEGFAAPEAPVAIDTQLPQSQEGEKVIDWSAPRAEDAVQLDNDYFAAQVEQDPAPKRTLRERIKNALFTATPASLIDSFNYRRQQAGEAPVSRKRLFALGGLTLAAVGVYAAHKAGMFDHAIDNMNNLWEGNKPASTPSQDTLANAADALGGAGSKAPTASAVTEAINGTVPKPSTVNAVAEQLNNSSVNTFVVEKPWAVGNPTAWSWAESQGIPKQNVSGFLREIMGANWQEQARGMNVGDSISATAEQIAKFKTIG